eukprot:gene11160-14974_t
MAANNIHLYLNKIRTELLKYPLTKKYSLLIEEKSKVNAEYFVVGLGVVLAAFLFMGFAAGFITNLVGFLYPMYCTIKAIETKRTDDDIQWLVYWVVFGLFHVVENFVDYILYWFPIFYPIKVVFLVWLMLPQYNGAKMIYDAAIRPLFLKHENTIDAALKSVDTKKVIDSVKSATF